MRERYSLALSAPAGGFESSKETPMRFSTLAAAVVLSLPAIAGSAAAPSALADVPPASAPATAAVAAPGTPAATPPSDAAARHAKRTACLKDAKAKKLVGADKTSFLKTCIAAP
jgi:hypothetical protein